MRRSLVLAASILALSAGSAVAADAIVEVPAAPVFEDAPMRSVLIGGGAGFAPTYEGSDEYTVFPFPILSYDSGVDGPRRFEFRALDDIRFHAARIAGFSAGPLAGYSFGREEDAGDILEGLGDVDAGIVVGGFLSYDVELSPSATVGADVAVKTQVTGDAFDERRFAGLPLPVRDTIEDNYGYGYEVDFGVSGEFDLSPRLNLATRVGATYASNEYMRTFFGVNAQQSANAAAAGNVVPVFGVGDNPNFADDLGGQIKNVYVNANLAFDVTDRFQVRGGLGYSRLIGDAADSPISVSDNQFSGSLGVGYRFKF